VDAISADDRMLLRAPT